MCFFCVDGEADGLPLPCAAAFACHQSPASRLGVVRLPLALHGLVAVVKVISGFSFDGVLG